MAQCSEGYLGNNKLQLIVEPKYARAAMDIYQEMDTKTFLPGSSPGYGEAYEGQASGTAGRAGRSSKSERSVCAGIH